jgi:putative ABC transport system permease protein
MTRLVIAQLAARWPQAVLLVVLSAAATAAAVSAGVYAGAADRQVIAAELAAADRTELFVAYGPLRREWSVAPAADPATAMLGELDGFAAVTTVQVPVRHEAAGGTDPLVARQDLCTHVVVREGRCPVANREAVLSPAMAAAAGVRPGDELVLTPVADPAGEVAAGPAAGFTVVGLVEAADRHDPYWGPHRDIADEAIYTTPNSVARLEHGTQQVTAVAVLDRASLSAATLPTVRAELDRVWREAARLSEPGTDPPLSSGIPRLLDRIDDSRDRVRQLLPVAAVPLVALCWFVVYLAAGYAAGSRRPELGAVAVRGAPARLRLVLAGGELALPVLVGVPVGVAAGHAVVAAAAGGWAPAATTQWAAAGVALVGSLVAVALGLRRELAAPAVTLLRWVPPRPRRWLLATAEVLVVALAVAAVLQARARDGQLAGISVLAPALVMAAVAVLVARIAWPLVGLAGRLALRRGQLGGTVAAVHLSRAPATTRLLVVVAVALGMLGFAAVAADVAGQHRADHAERAVGAARVLEVRQVDRMRLLDAVRRADPEGRYAMAAVVSSGAAGQQSLLAVDTTRLSQVAGWRAEYGGPAPERLAELLRPPVPGSLPVGDGTVDVELSLPDGAPSGTTVLSMALVSTAGERLTVRFGPVSGPRSVYQGEVRGCADGCRLAHLSLSVTGDGPAAVSWHGMAQDGRDLVPAGWWRGGTWPLVRERDAERMAVDPGGGGLTVTVPQARRGAFYRVLPPDTPYPLPVAAAYDLPDGSVAGVDGRPVAVTPVARLAGLPRLGDSGMLIDLEYAERTAIASGATGSFEVWLAAGAPAELVERLEAEGLVVTAERTVAGLRELLDGSGPAVALRYHLLAAGMAVVVTLAALVQVALADRRVWVVSLRRLRVQGLPRRTVTVSALWSYGGLVAVGAAAGVVAAGVSWLVTGHRLPLGAEPLPLGGGPLPLGWPQPAPVLVPWLAVVATLFAVAAVAGWWLRGAVDREVVR